MHGVKAAVKAERIAVVKYLRNEAAWYRDHEAEDKLDKAIGVATAIVLDNYANGIEEGRHWK